MSAVTLLACEQTLKLHGRDDKVRTTSSLIGEMRDLKNLGFEPCSRVFRRVVVTDAEQKADFQVALKLARTGLYENAAEVALILSEAGAWDKSLVEPEMLRQLDEICADASECVSKHKARIAAAGRFKINVRLW